MKSNSLRHIPIEECDALDAKIAAMEACLREADRIISPEDKAHMDEERGPAVLFTLMEYHCH
jgi:hypothetical protein